MVEVNWKQSFLGGALVGALVVGGGARLVMAPSADNGRDQRSELTGDVDQERVMQSLRTQLEPALQSWYRGEPLGYADLYADELSYFDPGTDGSLNGIEALRTHYAPIVGRINIDRHEAVALRLQLHGNVAILTYDLNEYAADGPPSSSWNVTQVYRKIGAEWRVIHGHFSPRPDEG